MNNIFSSTIGITKAINRIATAMEERNKIDIIRLKLHMEEIPYGRKLMVDINEISDKLDKINND